MTTRIVTSDELLATLVEAGIVSGDDVVRRVVIDLKAREAPIVYVEKFGDERMLSVVQALGGVGVTLVRAGEEAS